jgi:hypothetical protein
MEFLAPSAGPLDLSDLLLWGPLLGDSGMEPKVLLQQADRCLPSKERPSYYRFLVRAKGTAEYRAGRMEQALEWLLRAESLWQGDETEPERVVNCFFLSMAYQRLRRAEVAKAKYQQGLRHMEKVFGGLEEYQPGKGEWYYWPWCQVVRREAEALLKRK